MKLISSVQQNQLSKGSAILELLPYRKCKTFKVFNALQVVNFPFVLEIAVKTHVKFNVDKIIGFRKVDYRAYKKLRLYNNL